MQHYCSLNEMKVFQVKVEDNAVGKDSGEVSKHAAEERIGESEGEAKVCALEEGSGGEGRVEFSKEGDVMLKHSIQ